MPTLTATDQTRDSARLLARIIEPVVGQVYFAPECHRRYEALGFNPSPNNAPPGSIAFPDGPAYFTSRGSCLGQAPGELVAAALAAIDDTAELHAVIHRRDEKATAEAEAVRVGEQPFAGVPILVKDLDGYLAGEPWWGGSAHLRDAGSVADHTSWLFERLQSAGFVICGKTNTPAWVPHVAHLIAELKGVSSAAVADATRLNFEQLFRVTIPEPA